MLTTHNLSIVLQENWILKNINLTCDPGTILSILGPNGAGKSTLLKSLSGDIPTGLKQVQIEGQCLNNYSTSELSDVRAVMPQSIQLDFPFLVSEIIEMSLVKALKQHERESHVNRALSLFDVVHLKDRNYLTLSGGEQQRVQLARVISQITHKKDGKNRYLFLDECTSSLDLAHQHQVFEVVNSIVKSENISAIVVLHDLNIASQYSDKLVLMKQGEIINQGCVSKVLQEGSISEVYGYPVKIIDHPKGWPMVIPA